MIVQNTLILTGCETQTESNKIQSQAITLPNTQQNLNDKGNNMFKIYLSMRKIDSLSSELNLSFTKINARGL